jgi:hypothetical protein
MSKQVVLKVALILFLSAGPSAACDPEEMINELRAQCREAIASAVVFTLYRTFGSAERHRPGTVDADGVARSPLAYRSDCY